MPEPIKPSERKELVSRVGEKLVRDHGKKQYYDPTEVRKAALELGYKIDWHCWAYCMFSSPSDFLRIHQAMGEVCDYAQMKAEVLGDLVGDSTGFSALDIDLSWLEWPDIDLSSIFDWFDFSP
ncbi:MAG: hypothetical protein AAGH89_06025 [Verrucomicrobiota bacterium]